MGAVTALVALLAGVSRSVDEVSWWDVAYVAVLSSLTAALAALALAKANEFRTHWVRPRHTHAVCSGFGTPCPQRKHKGARCEAQGGTL